MLSSDHELHAGWRDAGPGFGCADHRGLMALTQAVNAALTQAREIHVTCPLGTDFRGGPAAFPETTADTTVVRFPLSVFTLVPTGNFSGKVVQQGFLVGPGANFYAPYACGLEVPVTFHFSDNQITGATGREADVRSAQAHYEYVGQLYGIEPYGCIPGMRAFIRGAATRNRRRRISNAGAAAPLVIRACCISTPAAPMRRAKSRGTYWIRRSASTARQCGETGCWRRRAWPADRRSWSAIPAWRSCSGTRRAMWGWVLTGSSRPDPGAGELGSTPRLPAWRLRF